MDRFAANRAKQPCTSSNTAAIRDGSPMKSVVSRIRKTDLWADSGSTFPSGFGRANYFRSRCETSTEQWPSTGSHGWFGVVKRRKAAHRRGFPCFEKAGSDRCCAFAARVEDSETKITRLALYEFKRESRPHRIGEATDSRFLWFRGHTLEARAVANKPGGCRGPASTPLLPFSASPSSVHLFTLSPFAPVCKVRPGVIVIPIEFPDLLDC